MKDETKPSLSSQRYNETFLNLQKYWFDSTGKAIISEAEQKILDRWIYADRMIRQEYMHEHLIPQKMVKEFGISRSTAFEDIRNAKKIFGQISIEDKMYYSSIHYAYALECFKKAGNRRDLNSQAKFLRLMNDIKTQWDDGTEDKFKELAAMVESSQIMIVVDDPTSIGLKKYTEDDKKKLLSDLLSKSASDARFEE